MDIASWDGHSIRFIFDNSTGQNNNSNDYTFSYHANAYEAYYNFSHSRSYDLMWFVMASTGNLDQYFMVDGKISVRPHALCADSAGGNSGRCLTSIPFKCGDGKFYEMNGSLPSTFSGTGFISTGTTECETLCKSNCSCTAFAALQNEQPPGCQLYFGSKHDLLKIIEKGAGIVYIRGRAPSGKFEFNYLNYTI